MEKYELNNEEGSHFVRSLIETKKVLLDGKDILGSETEKPQNSDIISCESCKKNIKLMLAMSVTYETSIRRKVPPLKFQMISFYIFLQLHCPNWDQIYATQQQSEPNGTRTK